MNYKNYDQIIQLDSDTLSELLSNGDAQERVWAAWEFSFRIGKGALPNLSVQAHEAPDPGTRRHMIVVLAGLGQYSVLSILALNDPDESVRGTAVQYIIKTTDGNESVKNILIFNILKEDNSTIVKHSILTNWNLDLKLPIELLLQCTDSSSEDVQKAAIKQVINQYTAKDLSENQIIDCLTKQTTKESINIFSNWLLHWELEELLIISAEKAQQTTCIIILDFLDAKEIKFSWDLLKTLSERKNPDIDTRILDILVVNNSTDLLTWLAYGIDRAINLPNPTSPAQYREQQSSAFFYDSAIDHFFSLINKMPPQLLNSSDVQYFKTIHEHMEMELEYCRRYEYEKEMILNCSRIKEWLNQSKGNYEPGC